MNRFTTNKDVQEMGMYELAHNCCYAKDRKARYRDFDMDMDAREFARNLMITLTNDELPNDDDEFDEEVLENLQYDQFSDVKGLIALFYRNLWAMADLRETLKAYEDAEEQGLLLRLPCKVGDTVWCIFEGNVYKGKAERFAYWHDTIVGDYVNIDVAYSIIDPFYTDGRYMRRCDPKRYGNRVFLTKEEAEQALKQMGE